jgi:flagellar motility protein MotE (MotC chaperone)
MWGMIKYVLIVGAAGLLGFPIAYIAIMFFEGQLRIEKGSQAPKVKEEAQVLKYSPIQDSMAVVHSKIYQSMLLEQERLEQGKRQNAKEQDRIALLSRELEEKAQKIQNSKKEIEQIVKTSETLEQRRIQSLAKIYASMRPDEAAPILETLPDRLIIAILKSIGEDRQKAKIMERMDKKRAGRISELMGASVLTKEKVNKSAKPDS